MRGGFPVNCAGTYRTAGWGIFIPVSIGVALTGAIAQKVNRTVASAPAFLWKLTSTLDALVYCRLDGWYSIGRHSDSHLRFTQATQNVATSGVAAINVLV